MNAAGVVAGRLTAPIAETAAVAHLRTALRTIADMPMPEQDNMLAANMRRVAERALRDSPSFSSVASAEIRTVESRLIQLAAQLLGGPGMPSPESWPWPERRSRRLARAAFTSEEKAREQCRLWAIQIKRIADDLRSAVVGASGI